MRARSDSSIFVNNDSAASIPHPGLCATISMSMYVIGKHARKSICHKWYRAHNDVLRLWLAGTGTKLSALDSVCPSYSASQAHRCTCRVECTMDRPRTAGNAGPQTSAQVFK